MFINGPKKKVLLDNPLWVSPKFCGFSQYNEQLHVRVKAKETETLCGEG